MLFKMDRLNLLVPFQVFRIIFRDKPSPGPQSGESLIGRRYATAADLFEVLQKISNKLGLEVGHRQAVDRAAPTFGCERQEYNECVSIALPSIQRVVPLFDEMLCQQPTNPAPDETIHEHLPMRKLRNDRWPVYEVQASSSGRAECR